MNEQEIVEKELNAVDAQAPSQETPKAEQKTTEQAPSATDDPEVELEAEKKLKLSELKKGYMLNEDYTKKTQELAEQRKEVDELRQLSQFLKANPKKLEKVIAVLDEKEEAIAEKREEISDELQGLDPNDPIAKKLRAQEEMLKGMQKTLDDMRKGQEETQKQTLVQQAQQVLTKTLDEVTKELAIEEDDKTVWRQMVLSHLKDNPRNYVDEADFTKSIKEIGKRYFDTIAKIGERSVAKHLKSKSGVVPAGAAASGEPLKKKPTMDNLEDIIKEELEKEGKG